MKKLRKLFCLSVLFIIFTCAPCIVQAQGSLKLTLVSNVNNIRDLGHAFLVVRNDTGSSARMGEYLLPSGEQATLGLRGGAPWIDGFGGAYINIEAYQANVYQNFSYITCDISQSQLDTVVSYFRQRSKYDLDWAIIKNCTTVATGAWNKVCPLLYKVLPDNIPSDLKLQINIIPGHKTGTSLVNSGLINKTAPPTNVYFMSKSGTLVPCQILEGTADGAITGTTNKSSIQLSWKKVSKVKDPHTVANKSFATGYLIEYKKSSESTYAQKYVSSLNTVSETITGLDSGTKYNIRIWPVHKYSADGKTRYITGAGYLGTTLKTNSVALSKTSLTLAKGKTASLSATMTGTTKYTLQWGSSNTSVATITKNGLVTAKAPGTAIISVTYGTCKASCKVTVTGLTAACKKAYNKFLKNNISFSCRGVSRTYKANAFCILDLNKDGTPELVTVDRSTCSHDVSGCSSHCHIDLWRYANGKVTYVGGYLTKYANTMEIRYRGNQVYFRTYSGNWYGLKYNGYATTLGSKSYKVQSLYLNNATNRDFFFK